MKKIIRLNERDLANIVRKVIFETQDNFPTLSIKMKSIVVVRNPDGTLSDKTKVTLNNGQTLGGSQIADISEYCKSGVAKTLDEKCTVAMSTNKFDLMCNKSGCNKMK